MIQTGIKSKEIVGFLKDNLNIIIVVPAFIGGLWQALELMSISITYIRFFSISQIVPDGLLIIMLIILSFSFSAIGWFADILFFEKSSPQDAEAVSAEEYEKYRKAELKKHVIWFVFLYGFMLWTYLHNKMNIIDYDYLEWTIPFTYIYLLLINRTLDKAYYFAKEKYKKFYKGANVLLLILYIVVIACISKGIHNLFITPTNIVNIENIKKDVAHKFPNTKQELLYFNDKYMFIKITSKIKKDRKGKIIKNEKIYIKKLESLFTD
ncbi:hypothetical protein [Flavobacterium sp. YO64]|uniref:hypothetical protein n=1 Tax=Flavobacterium sp. YO64 TaxID=394559 RepID=UPI00100A5EC4|nr:hypothetical protein [Flavobacterium sp. YO64]RXM44236.1 hypothetical protein BOW57_10155 [Flavobacterium sp. YO64]